ncbi:S8 family peptidase [Bacillus cereus]|uniref:S8 family peptidase n=1 Tax=Bacillus cereus TaxID=1396 RepID=UPI0018F53A27|nr:S8 family serine peptidase [Bacillus cereus]MBJ8149475.1 S8 family serine peptidase [Bacillus cereus]
MLSENDLEMVNKLGFDEHLYEVKVPADLDFLEVANKLQERPNFLFAEPQFIEQISSRYRPADPNYNKQWQWKNNGSNGGVANADVHAEEAWDITRGSGIRIAVIDNGFEVNHPDLKEAVVDGAGYFKQQGMGTATLVDSLSQYPNNRHGTFCAGIALARADNETGGCGIANQAEFIPISALSDQIGSQVTLARAVAYAADPLQENVNAEGADVISCSLGPSNGPDWTLTSVLDRAIQFAVNKGRNGLGTPIFWAVSNGNFPVAQDEVCSHPDTIAVGRSNRQDQEDGSAFGPELDFLATGVSVFSTSSGGGYATSTGTSFAAPCAAGIGALVISINPTLNWQQVRAIMRSSCDKIGGVSYNAEGHHNKYGYGRINAFSAVSQAQRSSVSNPATELIKVGAAQKD